MKRNLFTLLVILIFAGNCFGQFQPNKPTEILYEFLNLALSNDLESAKKYTLTAALSGDNYKQTQRTFEIISRNQLKISEITNSQIFPEQALFSFRLKGSDKHEFSGQALLLYRKNEWKILYFEMKPYQNVQPPEWRKPPLLKPQVLPISIPIKKDCPKCA